MPKKPEIKKVLVIGSGPIVIGQAAEFDYAGTQACRVLQEEGIETVLVNSNPATIMTDPDIAGKVYLEPLTCDSVEAIIRKEKPDSLLPTLGGQTGLNLAVELYEKGILDRYGVTLLGTSVSSIRMSEDREEFKECMLSIGEPVIESTVATNIHDVMEYADRIGFPLIVRPAYTLGGTGGGIAHNSAELYSIATEGLRASRTHQVLVERCVSGWKEIEYEVMRDGAGNCITVCNMENFDPVGIHTGDSIVVAPSQTLRDAEYQMLRRSALNIISSLKIEGGCNVQFALHPYSMQYCVIEVNPRVSRSSALASKATGYPIAKVATRIAVGYTLDEIKNNVTGRTYACFEPTLDYVVVKFPRWPFDKFVSADHSIGTQMKATGEVMSIAPNFEAALLKAVRSLELKLDSLEHGGVQAMDDAALVDMLKHANHERLFAIAALLRRGVEQRFICENTMIDPWFIHRVHHIVSMEEKVRGMKFDSWTKEEMLRCKMYGMADTAIARLQGISWQKVRLLRKELGVLPVYHMVDTCGAEFDAVSPYYYSCYGRMNEAEKDGNKTAVVLGSGPIRIGQGIEFDYCAVHCVWALKREGYSTVIINNNPETVSTDFDTADRLYFEPLAEEDVLNILEFEQPDGVITQFGGQTAIKLAKPVHDAGFAIFGTDQDAMDRAEDREKFDEMLTKLGIERPRGAGVMTTEEAVKTAEALGYPVLVRPSYVLGGQGMEIVYSSDEVRDFMSLTPDGEREYPVLIDKYLMGREIEVDAVCDGMDVLIPGIMAHIERAGVHSGDSISVYPAQGIAPELEKKIIQETHRMAVELNVRGLVNIQYVEHEGELYVIEVNPRSSRTVPYISKVTGVPLVDLGVKAALGQSVASMGYGLGLLPPADAFAIKFPVFSMEKILGAEISLGPEMKSTGEALGLSKDFEEALCKGMISAKINVPDKGNVFLAVAQNAKEELVPLAKRLSDWGYTLHASPGTAQILEQHDMAVREWDIDQEPVLKVLLDEIRFGKFALIVNVPTKGREKQRQGFRIRRRAVECGITCLTSLDTFKAVLKCIHLKKMGRSLEPLELGEIHPGYGARK